jgi:hypothetical protein
MLLIATREFIRKLTFIFGSNVYFSLNTSQLKLHSILKQRYWRSLRIHKSAFMVKTYIRLVRKTVAKESLNANVVEYIWLSFALPQQFKGNLLWAGFKIAEAEGAKNASSFVEIIAEKAQIINVVHAFLHFATIAMMNREIA